MKDYIADRVMHIAEYLIETGATVRQAGAVFATSKSTVHKDMTERLKILSPATAKAVARVLCHNKEQRHIRGGNATKLKYSN